METLKCSKSNNQLGMSNRQEAISNKGQGIRGRRYLGDNSDDRPQLLKRYSGYVKTV